MRKHAIDRNASILCHACMTPNNPANQMCAKCFSPLTSFAATDPVLSVHSLYNTYGKAMRGSDKPVVLIGMWLIWMPILMGSGAGTIGIIYLIFSALGDPRAGVLAIVIMALGCLVTGALAFIAATVLFRTTKGFLTRRSRRAEEDAAETALDRKYDEQSAMSSDDAAAERDQDDEGDGASEGVQ